MKWLLIPIIFLFVACHSHSNMPDEAYYKELMKNQVNIDSLMDSIRAKPKVTQSSEGEVTYKIGSFLIDAKQGMKYDVIDKKHPPKTRASKGDTLYDDKDTLILGDFQELLGNGIYIKYHTKFDFNMFEVADVYKGKLAAPNFSSCPKDLRQDKKLREEIEVGCDTGVNFAGHYTIVEMFCGCECSFMAIVDRINGKIYSQLPMDTVDGYYGSVYNVHSKMVIVNSGLIDDCNNSSDHYLSGYRVYNNYAKPKVYVWNDSFFKRIE